MCERTVDRTPEPDITYKFDLRPDSNLARDQAGLWYFRFILWIVEKYLLQFFHIDGVDVAVGESTDMHHALAFDIKRMDTDGYDAVKQSEIEISA